jgi:hydrogenase-4 membrane subunit HyfE
MPLILIILSFLAGVLICNAVPHLAAGLRGESFPTPFASPPGAGLSPPLVNVLWGWLNLFIGLAILPHLVILSPVTPFLNSAWLAFALGFLLCGLFLAWHFGRVRASRSPSAGG